MYRWQVRFVIPGVRLSRALDIDNMRIEPGGLDAKGRPQARVAVHLMYTECVREDQVRADAVQRIEHLETAASLVCATGRTYVESLLLENRDELLAAGRPTPVGLVSSIPIEVNVPILEPERLEHVHRALKRLRLDTLLAVQRALRWINRRYEEEDAYDRYISLWIAFTTLYDRCDQSEQDQIEKFIKDTFTADAAMSALDRGFAASAVDLLASSGLMLGRGKRNVSEELGAMVKAYRSSHADPQAVLATLALTLYALRNDLVHGRHSGSQNRQEIAVLHAASGILVSLMYRALHIMISLPPRG